MKKEVILLISILIILSNPVLANSPPKLMEGGAQPPFGKPGTLVTYRITYTDEDGDMPDYVKVYFPDGSKEMEKKSGDYKTGAIYEYSWSQDESLEYYFEASDGKATSRFPDYEGSGLAPVNILTEIPENNKIYLFSKDSNKPLWSYDTGKDWVQVVTISEDGNYMAAKTTDYIYFFSTNSNKPLWKYQCIEDTGKNENPAGWISISSNGDYLAGACPNYLNLFSKQSNNPIWKYESPYTKQGSIYSISISSNGEYIAIGTMSTNSVILLSKNSNKPIWEYKAEGDIHGLAISSNGDYIAAGAHCPDRRIYLFSKNSNQPLVSYVSSKDSPVWTADISSDGKYAVYGLDGGWNFNNIFIFSPDKNEPFRGYAVPGWVRSVSVSEDGKYIAAGSGVDHTLYLLDRDSDKEIWKREVGERVGAVSISAKGDYIAAGSKDKNVYLFSKENPEPLWNYNAGEWVNTIAISADGNYIIAGTGASQYLSEGHTISDTEMEAQMNPICGDGICAPSSEDKENCPKDCKGAEDYKKIDTLCGDGICEYALENEKCPQDCGSSKKESYVKKEGTNCGNGLCESPKENRENCPEDCCGENCDESKLEERRIVKEPEKEKKNLFQIIMGFFKRLFGK